MSYLDSLLQIDRLNFTNTLSWRKIYAMVIPDFLPHLPPQIRRKHYRTQT